jgi:hypothetical protein
MRRGWSARRGSALALLVVAAGLAGCGGSKVSQSIALTHFDPSRWLQVSPSSKTATITLQIGFGRAASGLNIDGATKGALLFSVPSGWHVDVRCENLAVERRYSCVLARSPGVAVVDPAIVDVLHPSGGLGHDRSASFDFTAPQATRYRLIAVSKGEAATGMWVVLKVAAGGRPYAHWLR